MKDINQDIKKTIESKPAMLYVSLAKSGLWLSSSTLVGVVIGGVYATLQGNFTMVNNVVQACQVLTIICVSILGWHGYKGNHILHAFRHWNDVSDAPSAPSSDNPAS